MNAAPVGTSTPQFGVLNTLPALEKDNCTHACGISPELNVKLVNILTKKETVDPVSLSETERLSILRTIKSWKKDANAEMHKIAEERKQLVDSGSVQQEKKAALDSRYQEFGMLERLLKEEAWRFGSKRILVKTLPLEQKIIGPLLNASTKFKDLKVEASKALGIPLDSMRLIIGGKNDFDDESLIMDALRRYEYTAHVIKRLLKSTINEADINNITDQAWKLRSERVEVKTLVGTKKMIGPFSNASTKAHDVKAKASEALGIPIARIRMIIDGKEYSDESFIMDALSKNNYKAHIITKIDPSDQPFLRKPSSWWPW